VCVWGGGGSHLAVLTGIESRGREERLFRNTYNCRNYDAAKLHDISRWL